MCIRRIWGYILHLVCVYSMYIQYHTNIYTWMTYKTSVCGGLNFPDQLPVEFWYSVLLLRIEQWCIQNGVDPLTFPGQEPSYWSGLYRTIAVIYCIYLVLALIDLRRHGWRLGRSCDFRDQRFQRFQREEVHNSYHMMHMIIHYLPLIKPWYTWIIWKYMINHDQPWFAIFQSPAGSLP